VSATKTASVPVPSKSINEAAGDCGCKAGALGASLALILYLIVGGMVPWLRAQPGWSTWTGGVIVFLGSAIAGKVLGLQLAEHRLQTSITRRDIALEEQTRK
jgi:hypothetical protein